MAKAKDEKDAASEGKPPENQPSGRAKKKVVEVICEGFLGPKLLKKGDRTSDADYVALLDDPRDLVREVK